MPAFKIPLFVFCRILYPAKIGVNIAYGWMDLTLFLMIYQSQQQRQTQRILPLQIQMLSIYHLNTLPVNNGNFICNKVIQLKLKEIISNENKSLPFSDLQLVKLLEQYNLKIARRTVAKYRDLLNIPVSEMRKMLAKPSTTTAPLNF